MRATFSIGIARCGLQCAGAGDRGGRRLGGGVLTRDLDEELREYVDLRAAEYERSGLPPDAARRAALIDICRRIKLARIRTHCLGNTADESSKALTIGCGSRPATTLAALARPPTLPPHRIRLRRPRRCRARSVDGVSPGEGHTPTPTSTWSSSSAHDTGSYQVTLLPSDIHSTVFSTEQLRGEETAACPPPTFHPYRAHSMV